MSTSILNLLSLIECGLSMSEKDEDTVTPFDDIFSCRGAAKELFDESEDKENGPLELFSGQKSKEKTIDNIEASALPNCK